MDGVRATDWYEEIILVSQRLPRSWHFQGRNSAMEAWCQFDQKYSVRSLWTHSICSDMRKCVCKYVARIGPCGFHFYVAEIWVKLSIPLWCWHYRYKKDTALLPSMILFRYILRLIVSSPLYWHASMCSYKPSAYYYLPGSCMESQLTSCLCIITT